MASIVAGAEPEAEMLPRADFEGLEVVAVPGRRHILCGVKNSVRMVVRVQTPQISDAEKERAPISVACVLDRSGSMAGAKLEKAKRGCKKLVKHLQPCDELHIIAFDEVAEVVCENGELTPEGKDTLARAIDGITAGGSTDLYAGLEKAVELLSQRDRCANVAGRTLRQACSTLVSPVDPRTSEGIGSKEGRLRRVFLFSDGCIACGESDHSVICRRVASWAEAGIATSTFGIGADFDEPLMRGIADAGKGRYCFLGHARDIPGLVSKSVHNLVNIYASDAVLDVRGGLHTTLNKVCAANDDEVDGTSAGILHLDDLHWANTRMVLLEFECAPPGDIAEGAQFQAASWSLKFNRNGHSAEVSGSVELVATRQRALLENEGAEVKAVFAIRSASDVELEVAELLRQGDCTGAKDVKNRQITLLRDMLESAKQAGSVETSSIAALEAVLRRAEEVHARMNSGDDAEILRRQCVQEMEMDRALSVTGFRRGMDSDCGSMSPRSDPGGVDAVSLNMSPRSDPSTGSAHGDEGGLPRADSLPHSTWSSLQSLDIFLPGLGSAHSVISTDSPASDELPSGAGTSAPPAGAGLCAPPSSGQPAEPSGEPERTQNEMPISGMPAEQVGAPNFLQNQAPRGCFRPAVLTWRTIDRFCHWVLLRDDGGRRRAKALPSLSAQGHL